MVKPVKICWKAHYVKKIIHNTTTDLIHFSLTSGKNQYRSCFIAVRLMNSTLT